MLSNFRYLLLGIGRIVFANDLCLISGKLVIRYSGMRRWKNFNLIGQKKQVNPGGFDNDHKEQK
ncbi:hypothetical protein AKA01nite_16300 [Alkalibacterium kapii]|uniref:Uncharacterized protein n=1 Tax=Alkalibacterium kapii TaxID=426704 RepID=A0A511AUY5_9LACT|nr:hypothetical protein AKA01nite_16300 [Alkalibacterium kapii]